MKGGWLGRVDTAKYLFLGIFFTFLQCFVVTAMITDVTLQNAIGEYGDEMMDFEANKEQRPLQIVRRKVVEGEPTVGGTVTASASLPDLSITDSSQNNNNN